MIVAVSAVVLLLLLVWLLAVSSIMAEPRGYLAARVLSEHLGEKIRIRGGVDLAFGQQVQVAARDVEISDRSRDNQESLTASEVEFALDWRSLRNDELRLSGIRINGARFALQAGAGASSGQASASENRAAVPGLRPETLARLQDVVTDHRVQFTDASFLYQNSRNGLDLDLELSSMEVARASAQDPWKVQGKGELNKQPLTIDGSFPQDQPFSVVLTSDHLTLKIDGTPDADGFADGYSAKIALDVSELAELLDILKLQKTIAGKGSLSATYVSSQDAQSIRDLKITGRLDGGQSLNLTGDLGKLDDPNDISLKVSINRFAEDAMPPAARLRRDLKLTGLEMELTAQPDDVPLRRMKVLTNGFVLNTHGKGPPPITVSQIKITSDGLLDLGKVGLRIGPPGGYFLVFDGAVSDALRLEGIALDATLDLPTTVLLDPNAFENSDTLGKLAGTFRLEGDSKTLALSDLAARTQGTDIVQLSATGAMGNLLALSDISLDLSADIPSGAKLLSALDLSQVTIGEMKMDAKVSSGDGKWHAETTISVAKSDLDVTLDAVTSGSDPHVDGKIDSALIRFQDVRHVIAMTRELAAPKRKKKGSGQLFTDVTLEPVTTEILQSGLDMDIKIDLAKLEGIAGTSALKTEFTLKEEKAQLGPVKFDYDGGRFDVTGSVDLGKHPDRVTLKGSADGWNFGTILQELNFKKHASGVLNARFDVSGAHRSVTEFAKTASGNVLIEMRNGRIQTRLINLAGLGVLPWLFSDAHGRVEPIVCLRAPLKVSDGKIDIDEAALETNKVQLVANGVVDLNKETLDVTGEPRPIGRPLSRSPWPFVVTGSLKHPKLGLKKGSHRQRRSDGATTMPQERRLCIPDILQLTK